MATRGRGVLWVDMTLFAEGEDVIFSYALAADIEQNAALRATYDERFFIALATYDVRREMLIVIRPREPLKPTKALRLQLVQPQPLRRRL